jgi:MarR family 2-MHQ and catechol resistance regulon transcriptional repressor
MGTRYKGSHSEERALSAVINLMRAANALQADFAAKRAAEGLTMSQFAVLEVLLHCGPLCQRDLAGKLLVTGANMTRVIDLLERHGWVERVRRTSDRRYITVQLTETGRQKIQSVFPHHVEDVVEAFSVLSGEEQEQLRILCRRLGTGAKAAIAA